MTKFSGSHTPGGKVRPLNADTVRRAANGRWPDILAALGIPAAVLAKKRNQPCPACGGKDRFQFIDKGQGRFVCRSLDSLGGDGFALAMHWLHADFPTALRAVAGVLGMGAGVTPQRASALPASPAPGKRDNSATIVRLWAEGLPIRCDDPVARYLANRGLGLASYPAALRHHRALGYWTEIDGKLTKIGTFPALLAAATSPVGELVALHRIYLTDDGRKNALVHPTTGQPLDAKKLLTAFDGAMRGAAIQLYEPEDGVLAVAEGLETALAVRLGSSLPCVSAISAWGLEHIALPKSVTDVHIMGDNDASGTGLRAAEQLAKRLLGEGRCVRIHTPNTPGFDWLDVLNARQQQEVAI